MPSTSPRAVPSFALACVLTTLASRAPSQTVWNVNTGPDLTPWIAQAAPGDILLLASANGPWDPFVLNKGLTLIGPSLITYVQGSVTATAIQIPAGQKARIVGLNFRDGSGPFGSVMLHTVTVAGDATFEDCQFGRGSPASLVMQSGTVVLQHCVIRRPGMRMQGGTCALTDCVLEAINAGFNSMYGTPVASGPALLQTGGTLVASRITATGGNSEWIGLPINLFISPSPALSLAAGTCWLSDSSLTGGTGVTWNGPGPGAAALAGNTNTSIARLTLTPGPGAPAGAPFTGNVQSVPQLVGITIDHGFVLGQTSQVTAMPGSQQLLVFAGGFPTAATSVTPVIEPVFVQAASLITLGLVVPVPGPPPFTKIGRAHV